MNKAAALTEPGRNALLALLPPEEQALLRRELRPAELTFNLVLAEPGEPVEYVCFPHRGVISLISEMENGASVEVATVGREGFVGVPLLLGAQAMPHRAIVQVEGEGERIAAGAFTSVLPSLPALQRLMQGYVLALLTQISQGSACNRLHSVEARCARWLLTTHDRVEGDTFPMTQEFLSQMLGVTRPTVSATAGELQKSGLIRYSRGAVTITDRRGLEAASCECYRVVSRELRRLLRTAAPPG